jgi:hypothetical protein
MKPAKPFFPRTVGKDLAALGAGSLTITASPAPPTKMASDSEHADLRVVVRHAGYAAERNNVLQERSGSDQPGIASVPYVTGLELVLVLDRPTASAVVDMKRLADMGLEPDTAMAVGRKQVLAALPSLPAPDDIGDGVLKSPNIDYIASLTLADGWDEMDKAFDGNLLVGVPSDDFILIANFPSGQARANFRAYVKQEYENANRSVSELLYVGRGGGWVVTPE